MAIVTFNLLFLRCFDRQTFPSWKILIKTKLILNGSEHEYQKMCYLNFLSNVGLRVYIIIIIIM
jgi:hypothetical protein